MQIEARWMLVFFKPCSSGGCGNTPGKLWKEPEARSGPLPLGGQAGGIWAEERVNSWLSHSFKKFCL